MNWKRWKLGVVVAVAMSLLVAGAGLTESMTWRGFVTVFCVACVTHLGAFLKEHPVDTVQLQSKPPPTPPPATP